MMKKPHLFPVTVYYEDTDAGGVVYHANYLKYAERGRSEYLRHLDLSNTKILAETGILFVVRRIEADYLKPARLDDMVTVHSAFRSVKNTSFVMEQKVRRGDETLCDVTVVLACVDIAGKPVRMPPGLKEIFVTNISDFGE